MVWTNKPRHSRRKWCLVDETVGEAKLDLLSPTSCRKSNSSDGLREEGCQKGRPAVIRVRDDAIVSDGDVRVHLALNGSRPRQGRIYKLSALRDALRLLRLKKAQ
jgi:hypothetical protein